MSNAPDTGSPTDDEFASDLNRVIRTLMQMRGISVSQMRSRMRMARNTWYTRCGDGNWTARQMAQLADILEVEVNDLYAKPAELIRSRCFAPLTLLAGGAGADGAEDTELRDTSSTPVSDLTPAGRPALSVVPQ